MKSVIAFFGGVALGGLVFGLFFKKKYEDAIDYELNRIREERRMEEKDISEVKDVEEYEEIKKEDFTEKEKIDYNSLTKSYSSDDGIELEEIKEEYNEDIYIISESQFGDQQFYDYDSFYFHPNGVISNEQGDEVETDDLLYKLGMDWIEMSKLFEEEDIIYVRNNLLKADYEVLKTLDDYGMY